MADSQSGERTEKPSAKRLREARDKGNVPRSTDLVSAGTLLAATAMLASTGPRSISRLQACVADALQHLGTAPTRPSPRMRWPRWPSTTPCCWRSSSRR
ncbi:MAG: EscU/YscU/HrcU family type III secretion system export apparatus switch protein [Vicinamibacterales bacterium]